MVLHTFGGLNVDLRGEVALSVHLVVHGERCVLRVAQVFSGVGVVNAARDGFFVAEARPHLLSFFAVHDSRARVLAEGQLALGGYLGVAQEGEGYVLVVVGSLGVGEDFSHLLVVGAAQEERHVAEGLANHLGNALGLDFENGVSLELAEAHVVF